MYLMDIATHIFIQIMPFVENILSTPVIELNEDKLVKFNILRVETIEPNTYHY